MLRVDTVPFYLKPFFWIYGYGAGLLMYFYVYLIYITTRINYIGTPLPKTPAIFCIWHQDLIPYFAVFNHVERQVWMNHPAWYMKPVHVMMYLTGISHICLGSTGNGGKDALDRVVEYIKQGYSTTIASDGPAGPAHVLKPGVLWMSRDAGVPVVPLRFICTPSSRAMGWDSKVIPGLFTTITLEVGKPIYVNESNIDESAIVLTDYLNGQ
jgi:lysophospholipid acyltransferase (LPLAT)-like uncharacterized protein